MRNENKVIALLGDGTTPIFFVKGFCGVESLALAVELFKPDPAALRRSLSHSMGGVAISERVYELLLEEKGQESDRLDQNESCLESLSEAENIESLAKLGEDLIYEALRSVSRLAGVGTEVSALITEKTSTGVAKQSLAGNETLAMLTLLAFAAREYSRDRKLSVKIKKFEDRIAISASFETEDKNLSPFLAYISDIASNVGIIHSIAHKDGALKCDILPYIRDISLTGVKAPDEIISTLFQLG